MILAGDIGGTKTRLAVFSRAGGPKSPMAAETFRSAEYNSLEAVIEEFMTREGFDCEKAALGVAGPVVSGRAKVTNLPWVIERNLLIQAFSLEEVYLLNDLEAIANAVPILEPEDCMVLNDQEPEVGGAIAIVAPGTGLGEAFLTWDGARYCAHPSEGGHADFGPTDAQQIGLLQFLQRQYKHVSYERLCSGSGLPNIYNYFKHIGYADEKPGLAEQIARAEDPTPIIAQEALREEGACVLCQAALGMFVAVLGAEASNLALKVLATGGVYRAGGIPPKILPKLVDGVFLDSFLQKGRFRELLIKMPISVIMNEKIALFGAANYGLSSETLRDDSSSGDST